VATKVVMARSLEGTKMLFIARLSSLLVLKARSRNGYLMADLEGMNSLLHVVLESIRKIWKF
jgi:hypothetical protein